jgi:hypothetical protein
MDDFLKLLETLEKIPAALNRIADAGFAIAEALTPPPDEDDDTPDPPVQGQGMGMG